jgi:iron complex outermembrane receptor protein
MQLHRDAASQDDGAEGAEGDSPRHQFQLHSYLKLPRNFELDAALYRVSRLSIQQVPGYTRIDARFGWRVREGLELSVGWQNMLDHQHPEFNGIDAGVMTSQAKRGVYGKMTWRF